MVNSVEKNLILCFSSIHVHSDNENNREIEYQMCYEQLLRIVPNNFDIIFLDNTMDSVESLSPRVSKLKSIISNNIHLFRNYNIGAQGNKGMGELEMLLTAFDKFSFDEYEKICYFTGRRIVTCPYVFDKTNTLNKDALMSNPPLLQIMTGQEHPVNPELYNDMFFSMKTDTMKKYVEYTKNNLENNIKNGIGSEQNLFRFVNENNIQYEWLNSLGFIRNDWEMFTHQYSSTKNNMQWI